MQQTSIDSKALESAVREASDLIQKAQALMSPYLPVITETERASVPRARTGFFNALPKLVAATKEHPELAKTSGFDANLVEEDALNVRTIAPLLVQTKELAQQVADASLMWTGEAVSSSLAVYRVANALVSVNPALRMIVDTLSPIFSIGRRKPE